MNLLSATLLNPNFFELSPIKMINLLNKCVEQDLDESVRVQRTAALSSNEEGVSNSYLEVSSAYKEIILNKLESDEAWFFENICKFLSVMERDKCQVWVALPFEVLTHPKLTAYVNSLKEKRTDLHAFKSLILINILYLLKLTHGKDPIDYKFLPGARIYHILHKYPLFDKMVANNDSLVSALFFKDEYFDNDVQLSTIVRIAQELFKKGGIESTKFLSNLYDVIKESSLLDSILNSFKGVWSDQHYYLFNWLHEIDPEFVQNIEKSYKIPRIIPLLNTALDEKELFTYFFKKDTPTLGDLKVYKNMDKALFFGWANVKSIKNIENTVLIDKIASNVYALNQHLFNKQSITGTGPVLKKIAKQGYDSAFAYLFDHFYKKIKNAKVVHNFNQYTDLQKLAFIALNVNKILSVEEDYSVIVNTDLYIKGWFDLAKVLSNVHKWHLMSFRFEKKEPKFDNFLDNYNLSYIRHSDELSQDPYFGVSCVYNPIDERGGFSLNTYVGLCKEYKVNPWKSTTIEHANQAAALSLAYLFGSDLEAAKALVQQKIDESSAKDKTSTRVLKKALHDSGQFQIPKASAEAIKYWRPYFIRNEKIRSYADYVLKFEQPDVWLNDAAVIRKVYAALIPGLPENLGEHAAHIIENGWRKTVIDQFVALLPRAKKESLIPDVELKHDDVFVKHLKPGDPTALYIGELSGCCQHINYGAGDGAAQQSFTQPWCSVITVTSENDSLLAQAFIWLSKKGETIVIDSLESIHGASSDVIKNKVYPALHEWVLKMAQLGYNVVLSDTYYGITSGLKRYLHRSGQLNKEARTSIRVTPFARLAYTDFHGSGVIYYAKE